MHSFCLAAVLLLATSLSGLRADSISDRAKALHKRALIVDTHDDTPQRMVWEKFDLAHRDPKGHIDIPRMRDGNLGAIFFSIWVPAKVTGPLAVSRALKQIDAVREQVRLHPADLALATTAAEVRAARAQGKIAALMGVEGGHMLDDDLGMLRLYAALGVRYLTLTHFLNNNWADASTDKPAHNGLTDFGKDVVRELNRLGVIVDISHVSDKTFADALAVSKAPVIASHSSCRAICNHPRNMSDDMMRALAKNGGVIQINYHYTFLSQEARDANLTLGKDVAIVEQEVEKLCGENEACSVIEGGRRAREMMTAGKIPRVSWEKIIEHIDHAVKIAGADHVGLGSDFDGATMPFGMEDVSKIPQITEALLRKGYSEKDIEKILGGNTLRVLAEVERVAKQLSAGK
ncbi:MAG: membrane dipeptidase [Acidobacteria bacterium]|nr:membrane dipeptidase [Acidobacteriota bacterium]